MWFNASQNIWWHWWVIHIFVVFFKFLFIKFYKLHLNQFTLRVFSHTSFSFSIDEWLTIFQSNQFVDGLKLIRVRRNHVLLLTKTWGCFLSLPFVVLKILGCSAFSILFAFTAYRDKFHPSYFEVGICVFENGECFNYFTYLLLSVDLLLLENLKYTYNLFWITDLTLKITFLMLPYC